MTDDRLSRAKQYLAIAEAGDAKREAYKAAAEEIAAAIEEGATQISVATDIGRPQSFISKMMRWRASGYEAATPFLADTGATDRASRSHARQVLRDPERRRDVVRQLDPADRAALAAEAMEDLPEEHLEQAAMTSETTRRAMERAGRVADRSHPAQRAHAPLGVEEPVASFRTLMADSVTRLARDVEAVEMKWQEHAEGAEEADREWVQDRIAASVSRLSALITEWSVS